MRSILAAFVIGVLLTGGAALAADTGAAPAAEAKEPAAIEPSPFKTEKETISYTLGMSVGRSLKMQSLDVDVDVFLQGMKDTLSGGKTLLTEQQVADTMRALQQKMRAQQQQLMKELAEKNTREGEAFLAENAKKEGVVVLPEGLQYKVLTEGTGPTPQQADTVMVNYRGTLIDGMEFDSSAKSDGPIPLTINNVVKGMQEALKLMKVGSKWQIFIPSVLAYGERGAGTFIGPNAAIVFDVELVSIKPVAAAPPPQGVAPATEGAAMTPVPPAPAR